MRFLRYIKLHGDEDGETLKEVAWFEPLHDKEALKRVVVKDGEWQASYGAQAVRVVHRDGSLGERYSYWDFEEDKRNAPRS